MDETTLSQQEMQLKNLETEFNRIDQLYQVGGVSQSEWENMKLQLEVARKSLKTLRENTRLASPIDGVVTARTYDNGDLYGGQAILVVQKIGISFFVLTADSDIIILKQISARGKELQQKSISAPLNR